MRIVRTVAVIALALASSGCATGWIKQGATEQDLLADKGACERDAETEYGMGGGFQGLSTTVDRRGYVERCLIAHGWRDKSTQTASVEAPRSNETDLPTSFPVYSR